MAYFVQYPVVEGADLGSGSRSRRCLALQKAWLKGALSLGWTRFVATFSTFIDCFQGLEKAVQDFSKAWKTSATLGLLLLAGCATPAEKAEQRTLREVAEHYRPQGVKPVLPQLTTNAPLRDFLTFALLNHPDVEAAYFDWVAAVARITSAGAPPDPALTFLMDIQSVVTSLMPGLMFTFPGPGKLRAQANLAAAESAGKYHTFEARVLTAAFDVKKAYYELYFLTGKIAVNCATLAVLGDIETVAQQRNVVNQATLQDVLRAQMEQERLRTEIANLEDSRQPLIAQFKAALGLPADAPAPPLPARFETTPLSVAPSNLLAAAYAHNPRLKVMAAEVQRAEAALQLAAKAGVPDFSAGLETDLKMTPLLFRPQGSVTLPIWRSKIRAQLADAQAQKSAAQARLTNEQLALAVELAEKSYMLREADRNLTLTQDALLPKARLALEAARAGYLSNQSSFVDLADAWRTALAAELDTLMARTTRELALAELELLVLGQPPVGVALLPRMENEK